MQSANETRDYPKTIRKALPFDGAQGPEPFDKLMASSWPRRQGRKGSVSAWRLSGGDGAPPSSVGLAAWGFSASG